MLQEAREGCESPGEGIGSWTELSLSSPKGSILMLSHGYFSVSLLLNSIPHSTLPSPPKKEPLIYIVNEPSEKKCFKDLGCGYILVVDNLIQWDHFLHSGDGCVLIFSLYVFITLDLCHFSFLCVSYN